ncbi:hypothetical protein [Salisediminibacterium halotolerans]|uniref:Cellobiose phosphorylase n=1 Tax=Salisediminibacterium halotolerans TaxID=517425 RepID=A0A1H9RBF1_9BACI|nr:hypothetical protein [Salisediminibacterium haloalkalitolerans]SER69947.1 hypothetical protein SAMN05444126_10487 [Salisediminibacterium haloalkalitolerans]
MKTTHSQKPYQLHDDRSFEFHQFPYQPPFASFLPGIAGPTGIPIWAFYVNRGQGIASFGVQDKDHALMEFFPADKSYQNVYTQGFRTFVKYSENGETAVIEPFSPASAADPDVTENMRVSENLLQLDYHHRTKELAMTVKYFVLPSSPVGALVRKVTLKQTGSGSKTLEVLDGIPSILPAGVPNSAYKELGNTLKSWFDVQYTNEGFPFYTLRGSMGDSAEVHDVLDGHFYASLAWQKDAGEKRLQPIVDRELIFGADTSLSQPTVFRTESLQAIQQKSEQTVNRTSAAFSAVEAELTADQPLELWSVAGYAARKEVFETFTDTSVTRSFFTDKEAEAETITDPLTEPVETKSGQPYFDAYARQSYLDNGLRGGFPHRFTDGDNQSVYYLYSRKHGDLERDYNFFSISPEFYSQGNGNYRDINQNRRCDIFFEPAVYDANVVQFMNLIQLDGYNPLEIRGVRFRLSDDNARLHAEKATTDGKSQQKLQQYFTGTFTPGELYRYVTDENIELLQPFHAFISAVMADAEEEHQAAHKEGFWTDHWTYNLDLIESFLNIYPDHEETFFFERKYMYYNSPARVLPRSERLSLENGHVRQYKAVVESEEPMEQDWIHDQFGCGKPYRTNLFSKLLHLALLKTATMAPYGLGIEMEAGKPGWNDSLNGLPGMLGAGTSELLELRRLIGILEPVAHSGEAVLPKEAAVLSNALLSAVNDPALSETERWDKITTAKENYRETIIGGISGEEIAFSTESLTELIHVMKIRVERGIEQAEAYKTPIPTYFYFEAAENAAIDEIISGKALKPKAVSNFLEGAVKQLKVAANEKKAETIYNAVRESAIYDEKLGMYHTSESLANEPAELGRVRSFTPGWLENESIFLHMEYKYLLEILKSGLTEAFYRDIETALIPFLDPAVYGRSTLENSSFIASSANPDPDSHGRGFVARLSGSTVEFLQMRQVMLTGEKLFSIENGELTFRLEPKLIDWMFTDGGKLQFKLLGSCEVTYLNPARKSTFGANGAAPASYELTYKNGETAVCEQDFLPAQEAKALRNGDITKMNITLA